jgi:hypothetical protein
MSYRTTISVDVDLALECSEEDLAVALVEVAGTTEDAIKAVRKAGPGGQALAEDATVVFEEIRRSLDLMDRGRPEEALHVLRMIVAEDTKQSTWDSIKNGKHPFLTLRG